MILQALLLKIISQDTSNVMFLILKNSQHSVVLEYIFQSSQQTINKNNISNFQQIFQASKQVYVSKSEDTDDRQIFFLDLSESLHIVHNGLRPFFKKSQKDKLHSSSIKVNQNSKYYGVKREPTVLLPFNESKNCYSNNIKYVHLYVFLLDRIHCTF